MFTDFIAKLIVRLIDRFRGSFVFVVVCRFNNVFNSIGVVRR